MRKLGGVRGWDRVAFAAAFQITISKGLRSSSLS
jgi:hypothetical protein